LEKIFARFKRVVVVEMNDEGVYGFGQLAIILRARYCEPKIRSVTKTDGLTYRVREILEDVFEGRSFEKKAVKHAAHPPSHVDTSPENVDSVEEVVPQGVG
jgi:2-oxoglutarate ferredoxin oxidoreductase subunit alpha